MSTPAPNVAQASDVAPTQEQQTAWYDLIGKWDNAVAAFQRDVSLLSSQQSIARADPTLWALYQSIMSKAKAAQDRIQQVGSALSDVKNWLQGLWSDLTGAWNYVSSSVSSLFGYDLAMGQYVPLGSLGFVWLIPLAVVAAATAYITDIGYQAYQLHTRLSKIAALQAQGLSLSAATSQVNAEMPVSQGFFGSLTTSVKWMIAGVIVLGGAWWWFTRRRSSR